jgi:hypothetical protein
VSSPDQSCSPSVAPTSRASSPLGVFLEPVLLLRWFYCCWLLGLLQIEGFAWAGFAPLLIFLLLILLLLVRQSVAWAGGARLLPLLLLVLLLLVVLLLLGLLLVVLVVVGTHGTHRSDHRSPRPRRPHDVGHRRSRRSRHRHRSTHNRSHRRHCSRRPHETHRSRRTRTPHTHRFHFPNHDQSVLLLVLLARCPPALRSRPPPRHPSSELRRCPTWDLKDGMPFLSLSRSTSRGSKCHGFC